MAVDRVGAAGTGAASVGAVPLVDTVAVDAAPATGTTAATSLTGRRLPLRNPRLDSFG